jgi:tRNA (adenine57-N1/adenine58-N1)-methyltransferase catalytic subunit
MLQWKIISNVRLLYYLFCKLYMIKRVAIVDGKKIYWDEGDLHTSKGILKEIDLKSKNHLTTHSFKPVIAYNANYIDKINKIKRGPQTLLPKDMAYILFHAGVDKETVVVDAGAGCGMVAICLARYAKKVVSYEVREDHIKICKKNMERLGVSNIELKNRDVYDGIEEENVDVLTLDLPEPWRVPVDKLKNGARIIVYLPSITQVQEFCSETRLYVDKVIELLEREWYVFGKKVRPMSQMQGHTAFLIIARKI